MDPNWGLLFMRYLFMSIKSDLKDKVILIGGPRQVGKTTLTFQLLAEHCNLPFEAGATNEWKGNLREHPAYLNWDIPTSRSKIRKQELPSNQDLILIDEIHKFRNWRNFLKGLYDQFHGKIAFLVTGSARLDYFRKGGDSLLGRSWYFRLHPLSLAEVSPDFSISDLKKLFNFGGFPEPYYKADEKFWRRWQIERNTRIIREDLQDLEKVKDISVLELLLDALPNRVGSPLSVNSLREDLQVSHATVERYINIFENLYLTFRIASYGPPKIRAVKKEQKIYFWDWSQVSDPGARFENMVASQLLKYCHFIQDTQGYKMELRYLRDTDSREIDFVVVQDKKPLFAVEAKLGEVQFSAHLQYFKARTKIPAFFQVHMDKKDVENPLYGRMLPFTTFCREMKMP
jgi:predicted AAA+ superfamily ATPase